MKLRVVVADDTPYVLRHLVSLLETEFDVVGTAENGKSALECIRRFAPDVAIINLFMPDLNGIEVAREVRHMVPKRDWSEFTPLRPTVVICSVEGDPDIIEEARRAGAFGYVSKVHIHRDLVTAVKSAAQGKWFVSAV